MNRLTMNALFKAAIGLTYFMLMTDQCLLAQSGTRPKVALVLSGGGAKGMAHIGVLKAMEEAGLRPDMITGTSMGSIIGGLYAMGYSASELEEIVGNTDWDEVLTNTLSLDQIAIEEKPWYGRYIFDFPVHDYYRVGLPSGLIEGQKLNTLLFNLTRPVHDEDDFMKLPIPFACVATDIETGRPITLKSGSLARSMRASMAIPTVFTPLEIDGRLLVDGGLVRNFPVEEAIEMGADIVIGVFVSSDLDKKEDLNSFVSILMQSTWVLSAYDTRRQKEGVDLYIEPDLSGYSTGDFKSSPEIIKRGEETGRQFEEELRKLADSLNRWGLQPAIVKPQVVSNYTIRNVIIEGNDKLPDELIRSKLNIEQNAMITTHRIETQVDLLYGVGWFENIGYELRRSGDGHDLIVTVREGSQGRMKLALHYDSENKTGINVNYTLRNTLFKNSRVVMEVDMAEFPRFNLNYLKYVGRNEDFAASLDFSFNSFSPTIPISETSEGFFKVQQYDFTASLFRTAQANGTFGAAITSSFINMRPTVGDNLITSFDFIRNQTFQARLFWTRNTLERPYYPRKGQRLTIQATQFFNSSAEFRFQVDTIRFDSQYGVSNIPRFDVDYYQIVPLSSSVSLLAETRLTWANDDQADIFHIFGLTFCGGFRPRISNSIPFYGAKNYEYALSSFFLANLAVQTEVAKKIYITAGINTLTTEYPMTWFDADYENISDLNLESATYRIGYALSLGYLSLVGPITVAVAMDSREQQVIGNFSFGFYF